MSVSYPSASAYFTGLPCAAVSAGFAGPDRFAVSNDLDLTPEYQHSNVNMSDKTDNIIYFVCFIGHKFYLKKYMSDKIDNKNFFVQYI